MKKRAPRVPRTPSYAAQYFIDEAGLAFQYDEDARDAALKSFLEEKGLPWRPLGAFLTGVEGEYPRPDVLALFLQEKTGERFHPNQFRNERRVENYFADFCRLNATTRFLKSAEGKYECFRVGWEEFATDSYKPANQLDRHALEIFFNGPFQPSTFTYVTSKRDSGERKGAWRGYAIAHETYAFFFGLCDQGQDASYFMFAPHPAPYATEILVGIQSLFIPQLKHAVSRHIVAIRSQFAAKLEHRAAASNWINLNRKSWVGLAVEFPTPPVPDKN